MYENILETKNNMVLREAFRIFDDIYKRKQLHTKINEKLEFMILDAHSQIDDIRKHLSSASINELAVRRKHDLESALVRLETLRIDEDKQFFQDVHKLNEKLFNLKVDNLFVGMYL